MGEYKLFQIGIVVLLIFSYCTIGYASPEGDNTTEADSVFEIELLTGTTLEVTSTIKVNSIEIYGTTTYGWQEIENIAKSTDFDDIEDLGEIKGEIREDLLNQLYQVFPNEKITPLNKKPTYSGGRFHDHFSINLSSGFFGINETIDAYELINGAFDMGAQVNYSFDFYANTGWNNTYIINLGETLNYIIFTDGKVSENNVEWEVPNRNGEQPQKTANLRIKESNPTSSFKKEKINLDLKLDTRKIKTNFKTNISAESIDIREYNFLPSFMTDLDYVPSDGIRLFIKNNMIEWNNTLFEKTLKQIINDIKTKMESTEFNQTLDLYFKWDPSSTIHCEDCFNIDNMDGKPPIIATVTDDDVDINIYGISTRALYGLVNTGGVANISEEDINFGGDLKNIGYPYNITIILPEEILFNNDNTYTWNDTIKFKGIMESEVAPYYNEEEKDTTIEIEVKNSDLNILGFFTGNPELNLGLTIVETKKINVTTIPDEFSIPEEIEIKYLNSDALRICVKENVFSENDIKNFLENKKKSFEQQIPQIISDLKINGKINRNRFDESVDKKINLSNMDKKPPVTSEIYANTIHPVRYNYSILPPSFEIPIQQYNFKGLENQSVTYRMVFPKGLNAKIIKDTLDKAEIKQTKDGRDYIEISFTPWESDLVSTVSCKLTPSWLFMIGLFMPCIITFIVVIILVLAIFLIRRRRKYKKPTPKYKEREEDHEGYEEEDYYVPPPPGSK